MGTKGKTIETREKEILEGQEGLIFSLFLKQLDT